MTDDEVTVNVNSVGEDSKDAESGVNWDLSHLDKEKRAMLEDVLVEMQ